MNKKNILESLKGGLVVSCQALEHEPLHSSYIMSKMALAAKMGGAAGIRANSYEDIAAIKQEVDLPVIGIVKRDYEDSSVFITATMNEVDEVIRAGAEIVALDATVRLRPNQQTLEHFYHEIRKRYPDVLLMADISTFEEGMKASGLGFDLIATTLSGYTEYTRDIQPPNIQLVESLAEKVHVPIMAEGGYWKREDLQRAILAGAYGCIVGSAITRPMDITRHYVDCLQTEEIKQ
jgi:N-acylglucosamine-6-phosphate 2-epimerase